jgi:hypothetical protein
MSSTRSAQLSHATAILGHLIRFHPSSMQDPKCCYRPRRLCPLVVIDSQKDVVAAFGRGRRKERSREQVSLPYTLGYLIVSTSATADGERLDSRIQLTQATARPVQCPLPLSRPDPPAGAVVVRAPGQSKRVPADLFRTDGRKPVGPRPELYILEAQIWTVSRTREIPSHILRT